jgi:hypothetical protein
VTSGGLAQITSSNNQYFQIRSVKVDRLGEVASAVVNFTAPSTNMNQLKFTFETSAVNKVTASLFIWNWAQSKWIYIGAKPQTSADLTTTLGVADPGSPYINAQKQVKILLRSIMPFSTVGGATAYYFKIDQVKMTGSQ